MAQVGVAVMTIQKGAWVQTGKALVQAVKNPDRRRRRNPVETKGGVMFFVPVSTEGGIAQVDNSQRNFSADLTTAISRCSSMAGRIPFWSGRMLVQVSDQMKGGARCVVIRVGKVQIAFVRSQFTLTHWKMNWNDLDWSQMLNQVN